LNMEFLSKTALRNHFSSRCFYEVGGRSWQLVVGSY
jgi:hypothetical protein